MAGIWLLPAVSPRVGWFVVITLGFFLGSVPFCHLLPRVFMGKDICALSDDGNPGAANVFKLCGVPMGILCLVCDLGKGFLPVFAAERMMAAFPPPALTTVGADAFDIRFGLAIAAPVVGHAMGIFRGFKGGKAIAASFGALIGLLFAKPMSPAVFVLAALYILFSTLIKIYPNRRRSILTFILFALIAGGYSVMTGMISVALGCAIISAVVIYKHATAPLTAKELAQTEKGRQLSSTNSASTNSASAGK